MRVFLVQARQIANPALARLCCLLVLAFMQLTHSWAAAQEFDFHAPTSVNDAATPAIMRDLAARILPVYQEDNRERYLANLSALQVVAGNYAAAYTTREALRERRNANAATADGAAILYDIFTQAKTFEGQKRITFAQAFTQSFSDTLSRLGGPAAYSVTVWRGPPVDALRQDLQQSFERRRAKDTVSLSEAMALIWTYFSFDAYRSFRPLLDELDTQEDQRRYITDDNVVIRSADGTNISAVIVRPRTAAERLPTLLEFTIYIAAQNYARECAAHGYVGVVAYTRGSRSRRTRVIPYQYDGEDAKTVINWIAKKPWSDGRVGMYGSDYSGFSAWAAANLLPPALKAIATSSATAPGINFPMAGGVFLNSGYQWASNVTPATRPSNKNSTDDAQQRRLNEIWYRSGRPYQDLDAIHGKLNRFFHRWLNHPSYDRFWQKMIPYRDQFSRIDIPILTTTGYYDSAESGALYYFTQHYRYNPHANQTLIVGPYDDGVMQNDPLATLQGYEVDPVAQSDLHELRYQWFDYVLKGGAKPSLLKDRVNYQVMGTNEWRHVPSLQAMASASLRFYLGATSSAYGHLLARHKTSDSGFVAQTIDLSNRSDATWTAPTNVIGKALSSRNGVTFVSEPLAHAVEFNGVLSGRLDFTINKMDMDLNIALYELSPTGDYLQLFVPSYEFRASYAHDRVHRHLLGAGERQQLIFSSERLMGRRLQAGSRVVVVLGINKRPDQEINYGTGNNVSEDSIADGSIPMRIRWYSSSYIDIPVQP